MKTTHVEVILGKDALAVGRVGSDGAGNLVPAAEVGVEIEADVGLGIVAAAIPHGWDSIGGGRGGEGEDGEGDHGEG